MQSIKVDAACVLHVRRDGKILAVSRRDDPNDFGLPGGKVDPGETAEEAAIRELKEETGLDAFSLSHAYTGIDTNELIVTTFTCSISGTPYTREEGVIAYVDASVLLEGSFGDYNERLLKAVGYGI